MESLLSSSTSSSSFLRLLYTPKKYTLSRPQPLLLSLIVQGSRQRGPAAVLCAMGQSKEAKLWGGRFEESVTDAVERFTESISYDKQLYKHDIMGSRAHASMLAHQVYLFSGVF